jgi:hypothetical protein
MNSTNPKPIGPSQLQKWGLFLMLAGSLGFTLSMNPDHFNNIARNEGGSGVFELAATAAPAEDAETARENARLARKGQEVRDAKAAEEAKEAKAALAKQRTDLEAELKKIGIATDKIDVVLKSLDNFNEGKTGQMKIDEVLKKALTLAGHPAAEIQKAHDQIVAAIPSLKVEAKKPRVAAKPADAPTADKTTPQADAQNKEGAPQTVKVAINMDDLVERLGQDDPKANAVTDRIAKKVADQLRADETKKQSEHNKLLPVAAQTPPAATNLTPAQQVAAAQAAAAGGETATPKVAGQPAAAPVSAVPPQQHGPDAKTVQLMGTKGNCVITVDRRKDDEKKVKATFANKSSSEPCQLKEEEKLTSSLGDIEGWTKELTALVNGKRIEASKTDKDKDKDKDDKEKTKSEIAKESWEKESKKCKIKGMDQQERLECYRDALVKMSNDLDDSAESKTILKKYFSQSVLPTLKTLMSEPTTDPFTLAVDTSKLDMANDIAKGLLTDLNGDNTEGITAMLNQVKAGSYSAQANHARQMFLSAQDDKKSPDFFTQQLGMRKEMLARQALNPTFLNWQLIRDRADWVGALSDGSKTGQASLVQSKFYQPVSSFLSTLPKVDTYLKTGANNQNLAALELAQMNFPDISGLGMNGGLGSPLTAGTIFSGMPTGLAMDNRINATVRGGTVPAPNALTSTTTVNGKVTTTVGGGTTASPLRGGRRAAN